jgi:hypothetical protein
MLGCLIALVQMFCLIRGGSLPGVRSATLVTGQTIFSWTSMGI